MWLQVCLPYLFLGTLAGADSAFSGGCFQITVSGYAAWCYRLWPAEQIVPSLQAAPTCFPWPLSLPSCSSSNDLGLLCLSSHPCPHF